ncbi:MULTISPECIES: cellulose binding domain-containing protein [Kitasatospora]|uniref:CBM3 domain-containing protein n=2 Tax=Kitasatospora TaxID=2063 RepID=A0ABT1IY43_9ACTN|nr:cellulose binding domain-containing protein [Kitasatospora paracochleata]MCP2309838.1 hypothetical protein [Kitasatospora paracochleata]
MWNTLKVLLLVLALGAAGNALYPVWRAANPEPTDLTVRYRTDTPAAAPVAKPWLEVINSSKKPVALADVTVRYYFTADGDHPYAFNCIEAAGVGCSNINGTIVALANAATGADHYLELSFTPAAGTLAPAQNSKGLQLQLFRQDHQDLDQSNDLSFNAKSTTFKPSKLVTAYVRGQLDWGNEPSGQPKSSAQPSADAAKPAVPAGVLFDNFHYTGPTDPALNKHGWRVRTSKGGPGIADTWSAAGVSFPGDPSAQGGQALNLRASTDGTKENTSQSQLENADTDFLTGTFAARIYFNDQPSSGQAGDHINQSFYTISPDDALYSELDNEYMPNGGWGSPGPVLDTTSWYSAKNNDRATKRQNTSLQGWHTLVITAAKGVATYSLDGKQLFSSSGKYFPRQTMGVNFNAWFIDLPFKSAQRSWDMKVNWFYYNANQAMSQADVDKAVADFYTGGTNYVNTVPKN